MTFPPYNDNKEWNDCIQRKRLSISTAPEDFLTSASSSPTTGYDVPGMTFTNSILGHLALNCDLSESPGYSRLLIQQYEHDARKNPVLAEMAGVFSNVAHMPNSDPNLNDFSMANTIGSEYGGDAVGTNPANYSRDPSLLPPPKLLISSSSISIKNNEKNHLCTQCGDAFDRWTRARDCAYKDLDQTPHQCGARCGDTACTFATSSEQLLNEHLNPRSVACSLCLAMTSKKNIARHQKETCVNRSLAANAGS